MKIKLPALVLAALLFAGLPLASSHAYVGISVAIAPPAIPVYTQPYCPGPGYIWTPGYWAWDGFGYYWVPGDWILPPRIGFLWTPGYWGYSNGLYVFNQGYWGPTVGFYGGINYGYGYGGRGYYGGRWAGNTFLYNTAVTRVNTNVITTTYADKQVVAKNTIGSRAGFNGPGGARIKPTAQEKAAAKAERVPPTSAQRSRVEAAKNDPALKAKNNKGKPKSTALNDFRSRHDQRPAAAAAGGNAAKSGKQTGAQNRAGAPDQTGAAERTRGARQSGEKAEKGAARGTERPAARANRSTPSTALHENKPERSKPTREVRKSAGPRHPVERVQRAPRRQTVRRPQQVRKAPQPMRTRQAAPAPRGRGPAQGPEEARKKKRKPNG